MDINCQRFKIAVVIVFLVFPLLVFGQKMPENYVIYSKYLKLNQDNKKDKLNYVIRVSNDDREGGREDIMDMTQDFGHYLKGDKSALNGFFGGRRALVPVLIADTLWLPLLERLYKNMGKQYLIQNKFSNGLQITMLTYNHYDEYFDKSNARDIEDGWASFREDYPERPFLIGLSEVVNDGQRAVFYFSSKCGSLCGVGQLVLFYKEKSEWKFVLAISLWNA
ncbi:MAG TPA: hypothetical protein VK668_15520 [Mucilaginibacter sp.]|nr:hypothetical protein [Mucilaginibacter sp.]